MNSMAVSPDHQRRGVGHCLFEYCRRIATERGCQDLTLDVEADNEFALEWYRRQGLCVRGATYMYEIDLPSRCPPEPPDSGIVLLRWIEAEACQWLYGFSTFGVSIDGREWSVGRLGEGLYRLSEPASGRLAEALARFGPGRRLLVRSSTPRPELASCSVGLSLRMSHPL